MLEQVAGRAGRGDVSGEVIIQTYWASHPAIQAVLLHDRSVFLASELADRQEGGYPPFSRLSNVTFWGIDVQAVRQVGDELARAVRARIGEEPGWEVLGPTDCLKGRVKDRVRRHLMVKSPLGSGPGELLMACVRTLRVPRGVSMAIDVDAYDTM